MTTNVPKEFHAARHAAGGLDAITPAAIGAASAAKSATGIYIPSDWGTLGGWATARAAAASRPVNVVAFGDSVTEGLFASSMATKGWFGLLLTALRTAYGNGGSGFHSTVDAPGAAFTGAATNYSTTGGAWTVGNFGLNGVTLIGPANGATLTNPNVKGRYIDVYYDAGGSGLGGGNFDITVDGGAAVHVTSATGALQIGKATIDTGVDTTHTVVITQTTTTGCQIMGIVGRNATGIVGWNMGRWGRASGAGGTGGSPLANTAWNFGTSGPTVAWASVANLGATASREVIDAVANNGSATVTSATAAFAAGDVGKAVQYVIGGTTYSTTISAVNSATSITVANAATASGTGLALAVYAQAGHSSVAQAAIPDLLIYALGVNDVSLATTAAAYLANVKQVLDLARTANPLCDIVLVLPSLGSNADASSLYPQYARELHALADTYAAALVNFGAISRMAWSYWNSLGYWGDGLADGLAGTNGLHPSDAGHAFMKSVILPILTA